MSNSIAGTAITGFMVLAVRESANRRQRAEEKKGWGIEQPRRGQSRLPLTLMKAIGFAVRDDERMRRPLLACVAARERADGRVDATWSVLYINKMVRNPNPCLLSHQQLPLNDDAPRLMKSPIFGATAG